MTELNITVTDGSVAGVKVVAPAGELDESSVDGLKAQLDPLLADTNVKVILFDFSQLEFLNSKGIGYLVSVHTHLQKDQREMIIAGATESVMDVISLVGLTTIIKYFASVDEAIASLNA